MHDDPIVVAVDVLCAGTFQQPHTARQEVGFERGGDLGIFRRKHLLAADDQRDLAAE